MSNSNSSAGQTPGACVQESGEAVLDELAQAIKKRWPEVKPTVHPCGDCLRIEQEMDGFMGGFTCAYMPVVANDQGHSHWIIWCLNRLNELGLPQVILVAPIQGSNEYRIFQYWDDMGAGHYFTKGPTRAVAVAYALLKALELAETSAPAPKTGQSEPQELEGDSIQ